MQLERRLRPDAYGRVRGGYLSRRRTKTTGQGLTIETLAGVASMAGALT